MSRRAGALLVATFLLGGPWRSARAAPPPCSIERLEGGSALTAGAPARIRVLYRAPSSPSAGAPPCRAHEGHVDRWQAGSSGLALLTYTPPPVTAPSVATLTCACGDAAPARLRLPVIPRGWIHLEASADPAERILGQGGAEEVRLVATDGYGRPATGLDLEAAVNVGHIDPPEETGGGRYRARYVLPAQHFPQFALLVFRPRGWPGVLAWTLLKLDGRLALPLETKPDAQLTLKVQGKAFGPFRSDDHGHADCELVVPPGVGKADSTAVDSFGNESHRTIRLEPPSYPREVVWPTRNEVQAGEGTPVQVEGVALTPEGVLEAEPPRLSVEGGTLSPPVREPEGWFHASLQCADPGPLLVRSARTEEPPRSLVCTAAPPGKLQVRVDPDALVGDGRSEAAVEIRVTDLTGRPVEAEGLEAHATLGILGRVRREGEGVYAAPLTAPRGIVAEGVVAARLPMPRALPRGEPWALEASAAYRVVPPHEEPPWVRLDPRREAALALKAGYASGASYLKGAVVGIEGRGWIPPWKRALGFFLEGNWLETPGRETRADQGGAYVERWTLTLVPLMAGVVWEAPVVGPWRPYVAAGLGVFWSTLRYQSEVQGASTASSTRPGGVATLGGAFWIGPGRAVIEARYFQSAFRGGSPGVSGDLAAPELMLGYQLVR